ncbi:MAG: hypothetical protein ACQES1_04875 [Bacteroidota bacterium]
MNKSLISGYKKTSIKKAGVFLDALIIPGLLLVFLCMTSHFAMGQDEEDDGDITDQQVTVLTEYTPVISDATRIEKLPEVKDTFDVNPEFDYDIFSKRQSGDYKPDPLKAARLEDKQEDKLDNGYARLMLGSKLMLNADIHYNNTRKHNLNWGINGSHRSGHGRLENMIKKVYAGYNKNMIGAFAKRMFPHATLSGSVDFRSNQHFFYGYNPEDKKSGPGFRSDFISDEQYQRYNIVSVKTRTASRFNNVKKMNYDIGLNYDFWFDAKQNQEHYLDFNLNLNKKIKKERVGADAALVIMPANYLNASPMYISLSPYLAHHTENFKAKLGLRGKSRFVDDSISYHFYPDIHIEHNIADIILPYASFTGNLEEYSTKEISLINPFMNDALKISEANIKQHVTVGFKGRITDAVQFNLNGQYVKSDNQHFFVNDYGTSLRNRFTVTYSDVELFKAYGELNFDFGQNFNLRVHGKYNLFTYLPDIEHPWHVPSFKSGLYARMRIMPELYVSADAFVLIDRYALVPGGSPADPHVSEKLDPAIDVNLKAEYILSQRLNAKLELNNLAGQNYEIWNQYPVYGFHVMAGISYSF